MTSRRKFLTSAGAAAGIMFCGCGLPQTAHAQQTKPARRLVTVGGKRVKTIDVHAHCLFPSAINLMPSADVARVNSLNPAKGGSELAIVVDQRLGEMDKMGIDKEILSINPFWYNQQHDVAQKIVEMQNDMLAQLAASHPDRFGAFCSLTLQDPQLAATQLETAVKKQGLLGAAIGDRVGDDEFSNPKFDPVWAKAEELGAMLFIHPQPMPELAKRWKGNGWLANTIGNPLSTTIALEHLIFDGTLDKFPTLKVLGAHGGGYLPSYAARSDHACFVYPGGCDPNIKLKKEPSEYLRQLYFDALLWTPEGLHHLVTQVGASQVMLGSDWPLVWDTDVVNHVLQTNSLSEREKIGILSGNAERVMGIKV